MTAEGQLSITGSSTTQQLDELALLFELSKDLSSSLDGDGDTVLQEIMMAAGQCSVRDRRYWFSVVQLPAESTGG